MNDEGELCGNDECQRPMKKDKGLYTLGTHLIVCSDGCELKLLRTLRERNQEIKERTERLEEVIKS
jgi:hypothetical protein